MVKIIICTIISITISFYFNKVDSFSATAESDNSKVNDFNEFLDKWSGSIEDFAMSIYLGLPRFFSLMPFVWLIYSVIFSWWDAPDIQSPSASNTVSSHEITKQANTKAQDSDSSDDLRFLVIKYIF